MTFLLGDVMETSVKHAVAHYNIRKWLGGFRKRWSRVGIHVFSCRVNYVFWYVQTIVMKMVVGSACEDMHYLLSFGHSIETTPLVR